MKLPGLCLFAEYYIIQNQRDIYPPDSGERISTGTMAHMIPSGKHTKIYRTLPFIVDFPMKHGDFFHNYVNVDEILIQFYQLNIIFRINMDDKTCSSVVDDDSRHHHLTGSSDRQNKLPPW